MPFPLGGLDESRSYILQKKNTSVDLQNVIPFGQTGRARGGSRPGLVKYMPGTVAGGFPVQEIAQLATNTAVPSASIGQFTYAQASGSGFSLGSSAGSNIATVGATASYAFACSCWDESGNVYVAQVNTTTGATKLYKVASDGTLAWTQTWLTGLATGSLRKLAGMVVVGDFLFVAATMSATSTARIFKIRTSTGVNTKGSTNGWFTNSMSSTLQFSSAAVNCLARCGTMIGVESVGNAAAKQAFFILDSTQETSAKILRVLTLHTGTRDAASTSKVVSDGVSNFYTIASSTASKLRKMTIGGVNSWSSTSIDDGPSSIAFDNNSNALFSACTVTVSVRKHSLTDGSVTTSANCFGGGVTAVHDISCDNAGFLTLFRNGVASNDIMGVNSTLTTIWGPTTFANTTHSGASVNQGPAPSDTPTVGTRLVRFLAVSNGEVRLFDSTGSTAITNGASFNPTAPAIFAAQNGLDLYFADGSGTYRYYNHNTNAIATWTPTAGSLPVDSNKITARLITTWRGRTVLSGIIGDPGNWFMSAINDPLDWDYAPTTASLQDAVSGSTSETADLMSDIINGVMAYNNDIMVFFGDHSIFQMTGDPMNGGTLDLLVEGIGAAFGRAFCRDGVGNLYFFSTHCGVYAFTPGTPQPVKISQNIDFRLQAVDLSTNIIRMAYDHRMQGLWLFITPLDQVTATMHYFFDIRTKGWFPIKFGAKALDPFVVQVMDADDPDDRMIMMGGTDGKIRIMSLDATTDDGYAISSYVFIGPLTTQIQAAVLLRDLQAYMAETSGSVTWSIYHGDHPENALLSTPYSGGTWTAGRNASNQVQRIGHAFYIKLASTNAWELETIVARAIDRGRIRRRV